MVERHVAARGIKDERILQAMRDVPRHRFVPQVVAAKAYGAGALPIGAKQTISQPYIVARMIELLELARHGEGARDWHGNGISGGGTVETVRESLLHRTGQRAGPQGRGDLSATLKLHNASVKVFDGTYGWSDQAPFDRIIVAAAAPEVPSRCVQQLARTGDGHPDRSGRQSASGASDRASARGVKIEDCGTAEFVPLVGRFGWKK